VLTLSVLEGEYAVSRLEPDAPVPDWAWHGDLVSVSRTRDELSILCRSSSVPDGVRCEREWAALKLHGPFEFTLTGILVSVLEPLRIAQIGIFAVSTFDTDYVLVKHSGLERAIAALREAGHDVRQ
jgi:uncharacterized protein